MEGQAQLESCPDAHIYEMSSRECEGQAEQFIVRVFGGWDFSTAITRFALMWCCWKADQSIVLHCKDEVFED